eukprot:TRINITY_DN29370_c0_g1_i1.p1 TRINITY_DN29370_c0_g1~~TRINITY_DN29370_c0_g1_i1.p1  ORF type:complete len:708 (+),score=133.57 TRINITY_DN29370_c0_g1_i1:255-2378(+)
MTRIVVQRSGALSGAAVPRGRPALVESGGEGQEGRRAAPPAGPAQSAQNGCPASTFVGQGIAEGLPSFQNSLEEEASCLGSDRSEGGASFRHRDDSERPSVPSSFHSIGAGQRPWASEHVEPSAAEASTSPPSNGPRNRELTVRGDEPGGRWPDRGIDKMEMSPTGAKCTQQQQEHQHPVIRQGACTTVLTQENSDVTVGSDTSQVKALAPKPTIAVSSPSVPPPDRFLSELCLVHSDGRKAHFEPESSDCFSPPAGSVLKNGTDPTTSPVASFSSGQGGMFQPSGVEKPPKKASCSSPPSRSSPPESKSPSQGAAGPPPTPSPLPRSESDSGYNSADEHQQQRQVAGAYDEDRERAFEADLFRARHLEVHRMPADGNCLFRAVADQVYGDQDMWSDTRHMCVDYMEKERDHFSQFVTENFAAYCKRKRREKVYGNNLELQAMAEMYNRPIHIYSDSIEPINIFHGSYTTDLPPIRLSYHRGNHYNSLVDPQRPVAGAGLGFGSLRGGGAGTSVDRVKAALKAQQEQQIDKALVAEGQLCSDLELTEQQIAQAAMESSLRDQQQRQWQLGGGLSTPGGTGRWRGLLSGAAQETSSSTRAGSSPYAGSAWPSSSHEAGEGTAQLPSEGLTTNGRLLLSMGFTYLQVMEAASVFGDELENMLCFLIESEGARGGERDNGQQWQQAHHARSGGGVGVSSREESWKGKKSL